MRSESSGEKVAMSRGSAVGFRFNPTEEELISHYLKNKIMGRPLLELECGVMIEAEIYGPKATPWELFRANDETLPWQQVVNPSSGTVSDSEKILFVFTKLSNVGTNGRSKQKHRSAGCGTWHGCTAAKDVLDDNGKGRKIGSKRMLTFRSNKKTVGQWIMHEYTIDRTANGIKNQEGMNGEEYVVCRIKRDDSRSSEIGRLVSRKGMGDPMPELVESGDDRDNNYSRFGKKQKSRTISSLIESEEEMDCVTAVEEEWKGGMNNEDQGGSISCPENQPEPLQVADYDYQEANGYAPVFDDNPAAIEQTAYNHPNSSSDWWDWDEAMLPSSAELDAFLNDEDFMNWSS